MENINMNAIKGTRGRDFKSRYKEQSHDIKYNKDAQNMPKHIVDTQHEYGKLRLYLKEETWTPDQFYIHKLNKDYE
jgi:hypothetical protein